MHIPLTETQRLYITRYSENDWGIRKQRLCIVSSGQALNGEPWKKSRLYSSQLIRTCIVLPLENTLRTRQLSRKLQLYRHKIHFAADRQSGSGSVRERQKMLIQTFVCYRLRDVIIGTEAEFKPTQMICCKVSWDLCQIAVLTRSF